MMNTAVATVDSQPQHLPATLDRIESTIALAKTPEEINQVLALMDAAVAYAKRYYKDQQDVIQRAKGLKLQAERKLGELLRAIPRNAGSKSQLRGDVVGGSKVEPPTKDETPTLASIGIDKKTSMRAQRLAALPANKFAAVVAGEIPLKEAIATPKKATAKTRATEVRHAHKTVVATEGSTYLIATMRSAYNALDALDDDIQELDKAVAMAQKLAARLAQFITEHQG